MLVALNTRCAHSRTFPRIESAKLDAGVIRVASHLAAKRIEIGHNMGFRHSSDGWIARHPRDRIPVHCDKNRVKSHARGNQCSLTSGMTSPDNSDLE